MPFSKNANQDSLDINPCHLQLKQHSSLAAAEVLVAQSHSPLHARAFVSPSLREPPNKSNKSPLRSVTTRSDSSATFPIRKASPACSAMCANVSATQTFSSTTRASP